MSKPARQAASMCQHKRGCGTQTKSIELSLLRRNKREDNLIFVSPPERQMMERKHYLNTLAASYSQH